MVSLDESNLKLGNNDLIITNQNDGFITQINIDEVIGSVRYGYESSFDYNKENDLPDESTNPNNSNAHEGIERILNNSYENEPTDPIDKVAFKSDFENSKSFLNVNESYLNSNKPPRTSKKMLRQNNTAPNRAKPKPYSSSNRNINDKSNKNIVYPFFGSSVQFLPSLQCDKDKFPNRKNLHHKRIFLRYVTNKVEKESEFLTMVRSNTMPIKANSYKPLSPKKIVKEKGQISSKDSDTNYYDTKAIFAAPPPPPPSAKFRHHPNRLTAPISRSKTQVITNMKSAHHVLPEVEDETKSINVDLKNLPHSNINPVTNVVDINVISNSSKLSGHYLYETKQRLSDLNLNEIWPASKMYKVTIKANPWVNSFKAKTIANEINSNFRDTFDSLSFSRLNSSKKPINLFPSIKNML